MEEKREEGESERGGNCEMDHRVMDLCGTHYQRGWVNNVLLTCNRPGVREFLENRIRV